jgi:hypothetical protein
MDMRDNEFDGLFKAKLDGIEEEPSAKVWPGIKGGLDLAGRRKNLATWLSVAASIVLLIGIGVFSIPAKKSTSTPLPLKNKIAKAAPPANAKHSPAIQVKPSSSTAGHKVDFLKRNNEIARLKNNPAAILKEGKNIDTISSPAKLTVRDVPQLIANTQQDPAVVSGPAIPDASVQLTAKTGISQSSGLALKPDKLENHDIAEAKEDSVLVKRRSKIHNFGDLVNLVVDKLDKRKDKLIQFSDDADGDSHLVAVNLGVVKIKKGSKL